MKKIFRCLEPGDIIWQVLETRPNVWDILDWPVTEVQWPYQRMSGDQPIGVDPSLVAINGPLGFILPADEDHANNFFLDKADAEAARLRCLYARMGELDKAKRKIKDTIVDENT